MCLHIFAFLLPHLGDRGKGGGVDSGLGKDDLIWESDVLELDSLNADEGECGDESGEAHF